MRTPTKVAMLAALCAISPALAQDLYDTTVLRAINFTFHDANWLTLLRQNYASETNILADIEVDGVTYTDVGVRIRGNTSYTALPAGSEKFSLNVEIDAVDPEQTLMGFKSLNLNNGFRDPTFCREVVYNNFVAQFIPNPRANHVLVTLNGQNWGVYINVQQFDKAMLAPHFPDTNGMRIKCPNNPNGPGLRYVGSSPNLYMSAYQIKDDGGLADPWGAHIAVCNAVTNGVMANWMSTVDPIFAVDPSTWSVVLENALTDDDSYINKGADFMTYRNPTDGRTYLLQTDANETFTQTQWAITRNFTSSTKPVLNRVLGLPELRQRYMAHYRTVKDDITWANLEPRFTALRNLIDAAVQADPKKLYSYTLFQNNFTQTVNMPLPGLAGGSIIGLQQFVTQRGTFFNAQAELSASGPLITNVQASNSSPDPSEPVTISAAVTPVGAAISRVDLYYRASPTGVYARTAMTDDGSGTYSVVLPIAGSSGQRVAYYVGATSTNAFASASFSPERTEWDPAFVAYTFGSSGGMRITEWMYSGTNGEYVEFTNLSDVPVDMTGWSFDDDHAQAGEFDLSAFGIAMPGESVVITEAQATSFRTGWGLAADAKVIGDLGTVTGNNLARNDEINLYDAEGNLADRLVYGDQTYPGTIRTQFVSGQTCREHIGQDDVASWVRSGVGDVFGSRLSTLNDLGSPGSFASILCFPPACDPDVNCDGSPDQGDVACMILAVAGDISCICQDPDFNQDGSADQGDVAAIIGVVAGQPCP